VKQGISGVGHNDADSENKGRFYCFLLLVGFLKIYDHSLPQICVHFEVKCLLK